jgi:hypothetical protein
MKRIILSLSALGLIFGGTPTFASNDAGLPGEFLNTGVGARPLGMGRAFTAVSDDVDSIYWNPAGLASYRSSQLSFQYSPLPEEGSFQYAAYSQPIYTYGNFGVGIINLDSGSIPRTVAISANDFSETGTYSAYERAYMAGYASRFGDHYSSGFTLKMVENSLDDVKKTGFGADWGNLYRVNDDLQFGLMIRNLLAPTYEFDNEKETFPRIMRVGGAYRVLKGHLLTSLDLDKTLSESQSMKWHFGLEGHVIDNIFLRAGIDSTEVTAGVGVKFKNLQFDYAAGFQELGYLNRFSMKVFFGGYEVDARATPDVFSPVGLKNKVAIHINSTHRDRIVKWVLSIRNSKGTVVKSFQGFEAPPELLEWDGRDAQDRVVEPGEYTYRMAVTTNKNKTEMTPTRTIKIQSPTPIEIEAK